MGLNDQLKEDLADITTNTDEWGETASFIAPGGETATAAGLYTEHHISYDDMGKRVSGKTASFFVSEAILVAQYYPTRDGHNDSVHFDRHRLTVAGKNYICTEWYPDEMAGAILLFLTDYTGS